MPKFNLDFFRSDKNLNIKMFASLALALFWIFFIWGFWSRGVFALGLNVFLFLGAVLFLFVWLMREKKCYQKKDLLWIIPLAMICLSFFIYENPFIKSVSLLAYPALFAVFINYGFLKNKEDRYWDIVFSIQIVNRILSFLGKIKEALNHFFKIISPKNKNSKIIGKIFFGVLLLIVISVFFVIPLLSSADPVFADKFAVIIDWVKEIISKTFVAKTIFFVVLTVILFSAMLAWEQSFDFSKSSESDKKIDPIISGIVLGGILAIYLLFLWVQLERLWVGNLPIDFKETESIVKSGFWQLFFLTGINTLIYFFTYRKTNVLVQRILTGFTFASLFLLFSAGHRMMLYVIYYGFSYEKFFASYTVAYCVILFAWFISMLFIKKRANVFKFLVFLFLWMFALISIMPIEQIIFRTNIALAKKSDTRIRLYEMTMLSSDVLNIVKKYKSEGELDEKVEYLEREGEIESEEKFDWQPWIDRQEKRISEKKWYEKSLFNY